MNQFDAKIVRVRFKRLLLYYIIAALIVGAASLGVLGYVFRDKLSFAYNYMLVSEKVEKNKLGVETVKDDLSILAQESPELADILVLDKENVITYSAKNALYREGDSLRLAMARGARLLVDPEDSSLCFWLVKNGELAASSILFSDWRGNPQDYYVKATSSKGSFEDNYFFERNFNNKKVYLLSYVGDRATGDKIYFISDIQPVENSAVYVKVIGALSMLLFMIYWVLTALWIYTDALRSRLHAPIWGVITLFTNLAGVLVYYLYKMNNQTCFKCDAVQGKNGIFCSHCGVRLAEACPACGAIVRTGDRFCKTCGQEQRPPETA